MADVLPTRRARGRNPRAADANGLLATLRAKDPAAFAALVAQHQARVAGLAYRVLGWPQDVEDVVQEVFVAALRSLPKFRGQCTMETWLYRITLNSCRSFRRKRVGWLRAIRPWREAATRHGCPSADLATPDREVCEQVRRAVRTLPTRYREVVVLRYLEDLPVAEISEVLGVSRSAVEVRLSRARQRLRGSLAGLMED